MYVNKSDIKHQDTSCEAVCEFLVPVTNMQLRCKNPRLSNPNELLRRFA